MYYITNAFSLQMLEGSSSLQITKLDRVPVLPDEFISAIGHADMAEMVSQQVGRPVAANRHSVTLTEDDVALVAQYTGPRLPEGATTLPEGATITWWRVYHN